METNIGKVGTEVKNWITEEVVSKKKIWSIPIAALAVALMLVGVVFAAAPTVNTALAEVIGDKVLEVAGTTTADLGNVFTADPATEDLAFTAITSDTDVVTLDLGPGGSDDYNDTFSPTAGVVAAYWNSLDEAGKLGLVGEVKDSDPSSGDTCDNPNFCASGTGDIETYGTLPTDTGRTIVTQAFHWDMLSDAEKIAVAGAGYAVPFSSLDATDRTVVQALYTGSILVRGEGTTLTVTALGDADAVGSSTVTVKANGETVLDNTIGSSVAVQVTLKALADLAITLTNNDDYVAAVGDEEAYIGRIVKSDVENVGEIVVNSSATIDDTYNSVRGRLLNGVNLPFRVDQVGTRAGNLDTFTIHVAEGAELREPEYSFVFEAYEDSFSTNTVSINVVVTIARGNQAPVFDAGLLTVADVDEDADLGDEIATFTASDPDHTIGMGYSLEDNFGGLFAIDASSGLLSVASQLNYMGDDLGEETGPNNENNIYELVIIVSDGDLEDTHTFTVTVTDNLDRPATGSRSFTITENTGNTDEGEGAAAVKYLKDSADAKAKVLLLDQAGDEVPDGFVYAIDENNSPEDAVALFGINGDGSLFLEDDQELDFEEEDRYLLSVKATGDVAGTTTVYTGAVIITIANEAEAPDFADDAPTSLRVDETANVGDAVQDTLGTDVLTDDVPAVVTATDDDEGQTPGYSLLNSDGTAYTDGMFAIGANGAITVAGALDAEVADSTVALQVQASDVDGLPSTHDITIEIGDANEAPNFLTPAGGSAEVDIPESQTYADGAVVGFTAIDPDGNDLTFTIREGSAAALFEISGVDKDDTTGVWAGELRVNQTATLDYDTDTYNKETGYRVHIGVQDNPGLNDTLAVDVKLLNVNDNAPVFAANAVDDPSVAENTPRGTKIGEYPATDADGDAVSYSLSGTNAKSFAISDTGDLMTLESLDYDSNTPCAAAECSINVVASDSKAGSDDATLPVTITVSPVEDSVSTLNVTKANPVPGTTRGDPMTALGNTKMSISDDVPERPGDLPNAIGAPMNFVETDWANWGTVLRIEVTAQSPDADCGIGNECVVISLNSDSADDTLKLEAYRMDTPAGAASNENKFVAAVMLVELDGEATNVKDSEDNDIPVYAHTDSSVPRLKVDEEDEIEIEFGNLRGSIDVENESPEISNFAPEHEAAFNDADVDYTFTVMDSNSGLPEPEDLPDNDGDADYTPVVALISAGQCETHAGTAATVKTDGGTLRMAASINDGESLYCPGTAQDGEYDASGGGYGFAPIRDDKDFDEIDDGFDVETTIVLRENKKYYVTFIACDNAGNCSFYDPDGNDDAEELAQITVDTEDPVFVEARTGLTWDSTDNEYDDNRSFIQVIFNDLTTLNTATVEIDDFVVEGHSIKDVHIFENPDDDDVDWGDSGRYGATGHPNKRGIDRYRDLENVVFIELEDELLADETPDVTIVPNGVEDSAANEQDDGDHEADDWISPAFTIVSIVSTRETSQDEILAGDDDEVTAVVTTDERLDSTRPDVTVTYVNAPAGSIDTKGTADCDDGTKDGGTRERGEIVNNDNCADNDAATGGNLSNSVEKVSNTEWIVTITEPKATGYYNFQISGKDRSPQENPGSEGVSPGAIVTDFFDADGDVNVDDAIFFEGDINLPKPQVRVSGVSVQDNEADVEFRSPLFVELDFAANHATCSSSADTDERLANCMNENSEYAEDNFDDVVVTSFVLDGVDLTDSVKTTDNQSFLVSLESISVGDHTAEVQAVDQAGNVFEDTLEIDFEVNDRDPFEKRLSPGWNLVSLPGEPADSSINAVFGPGVEVRTVYTYDPVIPGGWQVAVRETLDSDWQGDLTEINGQRGYWVLSDAIQDWEVSIPRLAGGAAGTGTPIQPPVIPLYAGWNLIPVTDISGNGEGGDTLSADVYLQSLDDGIDLARVLGFDTIRNQWETVLDPDMQMNNTLTIGSGYWIFVREATSLVPSGYVGGGGAD